MRKKFLEIFGFGHSSIPAGAQSETAEGVMVGSTSRLLQRADTGEYEMPVEGTKSGGVVTGPEYISPNQHGSIYGTVYRQYHGAMSNGDQVSTPGIVKLITTAGLFNDSVGYNGFVGDGTSRISPADGPDVITFQIIGWSVTNGWVDYVK